MMGKKPQVKPAATLIINNVDDMAAKGDVLMWLRKQAEVMEREGEKYVKRYKTMTIYRPVG